MNCSTMSTNKRAATLSAITANKTYQIRVRSGNIALDKIIHAYASSRFGEYLQWTSDESADNYFEIVFSGSSAHKINSSAAAYTQNMIYGDAWYTGDDIRWSGNVFMPEAEITSGSIFTWQKSIMTVMMKDSEERILWGAHFNYKGISEPAGLYINTADEAARISIDRIAERFKNDYIFIQKSQVQNKMPDIALIVERNASGNEEDTTKKEIPYDENTSPLISEHGLITF